MRLFRFSLALFMLVMLFITIANASIGTLGTDINLVFGSTTTSEALVVSASPSPNQVLVVSVQLGATPAPVPSIAPSPATDAWSSIACGTTYAQYVFYHVVVAGDGQHAIGTVNLSSASGGLIHAGIRTGMNTTIPIGSCLATSAPGTNLTPTISMAAPWQNTLAEAAFETAGTAHCSGVGVCAPTGWTEDGYTSGSVLGEAQYDNSQSDNMPSASVVWNGASSNGTKMLLWFDNPPTLTAINNVCGELNLLGTGC